MGNCMKENHHSHKQPSLSQQKPIASVYNPETYKEK